MPLFTSVDFDAVARALGGSATVNQVFKANGSGSGTMGKNTQIVAGYLDVGKSGDAQYTTVATAVTAAIAAGVSASNPYEIRIHPGVYSENPMTVPPGLFVRATDSRADTCIIQAADPNNDLFTLTGGNIIGFRVEGVTDAAKCLIRCATAATLNTILQISLRSCSNGIIVSGGAAAILVTNSLIIGAPGQGISGAAYTVTGAGSYLGIAGLFCSCPTALLPFYVSNPVQRLIEVNDSAQCYMATLSAAVAAKDATADILYVDNGARLFLVGGQIANTGNGIHIGSTGSNTQATILGADLINNTVDVKIESATGRVFSNLVTDSLSTSITSGGKLIGTVQSADDNVMRLLGDVLYEYLASGNEMDLGKFFSVYASTGVTSGGEVTAATGLHVNVAAGEACVRRGSPTNDSSSHTWTPVTDLDLTASNTNYIIYNATTDTIQATLSPPGYGEQVLLATVVTDGSGIRFLHKTRNYVTGPDEIMRTYLMSTRKRALNSGLSVTASLNVTVVCAAAGYTSCVAEDIGKAVVAAPSGDSGILVSYDNATRTWIITPDAPSDVFAIGQTLSITLGTGAGTVEASSIVRFNVDVGSYYIVLDLLSYAGSTDTAFSYFYGTNGATEVADLNDLDDVYYDNAGSLTEMTLDYFKSDTVILTSDGRISVIYGTAEYDTVEAAEASASENTPTFMEPTSFPLAQIITKKANGIQSIIDIRAVPGSGTGGGGGGVSVHSALSGLGADDHTQYMLVNGGRAMSGSLNMGTNTITNAGTINSVSIAAHASRHQPGGSDAISLGTPTAVLVNAAAAEGSAASLARSDHQHGIATGTPSTIGASNTEGASSSTARLDHVHAHGSQAGGSTHSVATTVVDGFMSGADKLKLDGVAAGATATPLSDVVAVDVTKAAATAGVAAAASRQDHKHDVSTATPAVSAVQVGNTAAEGAATSLARSDHQHAVSAGTPVSVTTANAAGSAATFARSDHEHSGLTRGANDFSVFSSKATPVAADLLLIEDSAAAGVKKQATIENVAKAVMSDTVPANVTKAAASAGVATTVSRQDHKHDVSTAAPAAGAVQIGGSATEGSATSLARSDHLHTVTGGSPVAVSTANADGDATTFARSNHVHSGLTRGANDFSVFSAKTTPVAADLLLIEDSAAAGVKKQVTLTNLLGTVLSSTAPVNVTKATAAAGTATDAARQDHKHDITTAAPAAGAVQIGGSATEGSATSLARSDHLHTVTGGSPVSVGTANADGAATTFPRSDHVHSGLTRGANDFSVFTAKTVPVTADLLLIEDSEAAGVKKQATLQNVVLGGTTEQWVSAPATSGSTGVKGSMAYDGTYLYVCVATNTWVRFSVIGSF